MLSKFQIRRKLRQANKLFDLPRGWLWKIAQVESACNPSAVNKSSGAAGIFQFLKSTADEERIDPFNVAEAAAATAKRLKRFDPTYQRFLPAMKDACNKLTAYYLSHQQGERGIQQILLVASNPGVQLSEARLRNMRGNYPRALDGTHQEMAQQFLAYWDLRLGG
jgi:hypothetical protein